MPTIIDSLIVTLGLDGSGFAKGATQTRDELKKVSAAADESAKVADEMAKRFVQGLSRVRNELLGLFALVTAGRSMKSLASDIMHADIAAGRVSTSLGLSAQELSGWQGAAERAGGSAAGITASMQSLSAQIERFKQTGEGAESFFPWLARLHVSLTNSAGQWKSISQLYDDIAASPLLRGMDSKAQTSLLTQLGMDPGTIALVVQGLENIRKLRSEAETRNAPTAEDIQRARELQRVLLNLRDDGEGFARVIMNDISPAIIDMLRALDGWLVREMPAWEATIGAEIKQLLTFLQGMNWTDKGGFWEQAREVIHEIRDILASIYNWSPPPWLRALLGIPAADPRAPTQLDRNLGVPGQQSPPPTAAPVPPVDTRRWWERFYKPGPGLFSRSSSHSSPTAPPVEAAPGAYKPVLDLVGKSEGTDRGQGYNESLSYGRWTGGNVNLTGMTLDQIDALQQSMLDKQHAAGIGGSASSALGRYQFTQTTLREMRTKYHLDGGSLFDQGMQDRLAVMRIQMAGGATLANLAKIWASLPDPLTGRSHYAGQGAHASVGDVQRAIDSIRRDTAGAGAQWAQSRPEAAGSRDTHISTGPITVNTAAKDGREVASALRSYLADPLYQQGRRANA